MEDLRKLITKKLNNAAFNSAFAISDVDEIVALIIRVTDEVINTDRGGVGGCDAGYSLIEDNLRKRQRIKRDTLLGK